MLKIMLKILAFIIGISFVILWLYLAINHAWIPMILSIIVLFAIAIPFGRLEKRQEQEERRKRTEESKRQAVAARMAAQTLPKTTCPRCKWENAFLPTTEPLSWSMKDRLSRDLGGPIYYRELNGCQITRWEVVLHEKCTRCNYATAVVEVFGHTIQKKEKRSDAYYEYRRKKRENEDPWDYDIDYSQPEEVLIERKVYKQSDSIMGG